MAATRNPGDDDFIIAGHGPGQIPKHLKTLKLKDEKENIPEVKEEVENGNV